MMLRAADAGNVNAMLYSAVDLCFIPAPDSRLRPLVATSGKETRRSGIDTADSKGVTFLRSAIKRRNADAAFLMGCLLEDGKAGVEKNLALAQEYFQNASKWGLKGKS